MNLFTSYSHLTYLRVALGADGDQGTWTPPLDVYETVSHVVLELELPGASPADVRLSCRPDALLVEGVKPRAPHATRGAIAQALCVERAAGPFRRLVRLPARIDPAGARASVRNGLLTVRLPKLAGPRPPAATPGARA